MKVRIALVQSQGPDGHYCKLRIYDRRGRKVCVELSLSELGSLISGLIVSAEAEWVMPDDHRGPSAEQAERKAATKGGEP